MKASCSAIRSSRFVRARTRRLAFAGGRGVGRFGWRLAFGFGKRGPDTGPKPQGARGCEQQGDNDQAPRPARRGSFRGLQLITGCTAAGQSADAAPPRQVPPRQRTSASRQPDRAGRAAKRAAVPASARPPPPRRQGFKTFGRAVCGPTRLFQSDGHVVDLRRQDRNSAAHARLKRGEFLQPGRQHVTIDRGPKEPATRRMSESFPWSASVQHEFGDEKIAHPAFAVTTWMRRSICARRRAIACGSSMDSVSMARR